jgi:hypothetical protein
MYNRGGKKKVGSPHAIISEVQMYRKEEKKTTASTTFLWSKRSGASTLKILRTSRELRFLSNICLCKHDNETQRRLKHKGGKK